MPQPPPDPAQLRTGAPARNTAYSTYPRYLTEGHFDNLEKIKSYSGPLMMIGDIDVKFTVEEIT